MEGPSVGCGTTPARIADRQTAEEKLNAFKTVTAYNSQPVESRLFGRKVDQVFSLARKEAYMSGIFWGLSGLTGNLAMLCLLGYGAFLPYMLQFHQSWLAVSDSGG